MLFTQRWCHGLTSRDQAQSCLLLGVHHEAQGTHMHPQSDEHTKESTAWAITVGPTCIRCHHNSESHPGGSILFIQFWLEFCAERTDMKRTDSNQGMTQKVQFLGCSGWDQTVAGSSLTTTLYNDNWCAGLAGRKDRMCLWIIRDYSLSEATQCYVLNVKWTFSLNVLNVLNSFPECSIHQQITFLTFWP